MLLFIKKKIYQKNKLSFNFPHISFQIIYYKNQSNILKYFVSEAAATKTKRERESERVYLCWAAGARWYIRELHCMGAPSAASRCTWIFFLARDFFVVVHSALLCSGVLGPRRFTSSSPRERTEQWRGIARRGDTHTLHRAERERERPPQGDAFSGATAR